MGNFIGCALEMHPGEPVFEELGKPWESQVEAE